MDVAGGFFCPADFHFHARFHGVFAAGVDGVQHRCIRAIKFDKCPGKGLIQRMFFPWLFDPSPGSYHAGLFNLNKLT